MKQGQFGDYETLVAGAEKFHGGICNGIKTGTRMTMSGLERIGIVDPKGADRKKLMVFVEIDRCCTDAIMALTGCRPGKRTMKIREYGKMAATFINLETEKAVRVSVKAEKGTDAGKTDPPDMATAPEKMLFDIVDVKVFMAFEEMPGKSMRRTICDCCGEYVLDGRELEREDGNFCRPCTEKENYYSVVA